MEGINIGIANGDSKSDWNKRFCEAFDKKLRDGFDFSYSIVDINRNDWLDRIKPFNIIIWKSHWMGRLSNHFKEKIFLIKNHLNIEIMPNLDTIWHFESKIAQNYLFKHYNIKTPNTFISFDYSEAIDYIENCHYPQILKLSAGAGSNNVRMIKNKKEALKIIKKHFTKTIFSKIIKQYCDHQMFGVIYLQDFIPDNDADLRITVLGDKYAFGFWRENRENDFRASGSGKIDYKRNIPEEPLKYCLEVSKILNFDSMAYDIIFKNEEFLITEISYGYNQNAIFNAPGYYEKLNTGKIIFKEGHYWPQYLWVEWLFNKYKIPKTDSG
jgi:hypothetical protein